MNSECEYFRNLIKDDLAGELSRERYTELSEHLEHCPACAQEKEELAQVVGLFENFEDLPVPGHFFVPEQPRLTLMQMIRSLSTGTQWAGAAAAACLVFMFGLVLLNIQVQLDENTVLVSFGKTKDLNSQQEINERIAEAVKAAREEDNLILAQVLERQDQMVNASLQLLNQKVDTRFSELETSVFNTMESNNRILKNQIDVNILKYGELIRTQHQGDLRRINNRLDQIALEGRRRETQNGTIMATLAQYGLPGNRPKGDIYE
jgi:hypothetical protein